MKTLKLFLLAAVTLMPLHSYSRYTESCWPTETNNSPFVGWGQNTGSVFSRIVLRALDGNEHDLEQTMNLSDMKAFPSEFEPIDWSQRSKEYADLYALDSKEGKTLSEQVDSYSESRSYETEMSVTFNNHSYLAKVEKVLGYPIAGKTFTQKFRCRYEFWDTTIRDDEM